MHIVMLVNRIMRPKKISPSHPVFTFVDNASNLNTIKHTLNLSESIVIKIV